MGFGIYSAIAGANAREAELEVIANNIANVQTAGFKEMQVSFSSEIERNLNPTEEEKMQSLVRQGRTTINAAAGPLFDTGNPLDMALQGDGFFEIQTPAGNRYTRNGNFSVSRDGTLVTQQGYPVLTTNGAVTLPPNTGVFVSSAGQITADGDLLGTLRIVVPSRWLDTATDATGGTMQRKEGLIADGGNLYNIEDGVSQARKFQVAQGHLENSNVDVIRNLTRLIEVSRAYEAHHKSLSKMMEGAQLLNQLARVG